MRLLLCFFCLLLAEGGLSFSGLCSPRVKNVPVRTGWRGLAQGPTCNQLFRAGNLLAARPRSVLPPPRRTALICLLHSGLVSDGGAEEQDQASGQLEAAEGKMNAGKEELKTAGGKLKTAEGKLEVAEGKLEAAEGKLEAAEGELEAAEGKLEAAEGKLEAADPQQKALAQKACDRAEKAYELAVKNVDTARENVNRAGRAVDIALDALQRAGAAPLLRRGDQPGPRTDWNIKLVKAMRTGKGASTFAGGGTIQGFAYLPLSARFDPTLKRHIHRQLIPVPGATPSQGLVPAVGFGAELTPLGEEEHIKPVLHPWLTANGLALTTKLTEQEQMGFVTGTVDAYKADSLGRKGAILEIKGAEQTLMYALRQASLYSSGIAMAQYARDVAPQDICIPVAAANGFLLQFGATFMLPPSLPVFMTISKVFDLTTEAENLEAKRYFDCFLTKGATEPTVTQALGRRLERNSETEMVLDCNQHWVKELTPDVFDRGLGMFAVEERNYEARVAKGLEHMIRSLNRLYADETARTVVVFPLCVISGGAKAVEEGDDTVQERTRECTFPLLVYPNMVLEGFTVGVPHHDTETFEAYLRAVEKAVDVVHAAGVVHLDLYVSNIMHRVQNGTIEIKIIDWDAAHLIGEPPGSDRVKAALRGHRNRGATFVGVEHDREYVAALRKEGTAQIWQRLAVGNSKSDLDDAFFELLNL